MPQKIVERGMNDLRRKKLQETRFFGPNPTAQAFVKKMDDSGKTMDDLEATGVMDNPKYKRIRKVI